MPDVPQFLVSQSTTATGPWTAVAGSPFTIPVDTITGLSSTGTYYFQIIEHDPLFNLSGTPIVVGPFSPTVVLVESAQGTTLTSVSGTIIDLPLNIWNLVSSPTAGLQIAKNTIVDPVTNTVILLLYWNSTIYQENSALDWYYWNGIGWTLTTGDPRITPSLGGTRLTSTVGAIIDVSLNSWTLASSATAGLQAVQNGVVDTTTNNIILLLYFNNLVYQENSDPNWWYWNGTVWIATTNPEAAGITESSNGQFISGTTGHITDTELNAWTLVQSADSIVNLLGDTINIGAASPSTLPLFWTFDAPNLTCAVNSFGIDQTNGFNFINLTFGGVLVESEGGLYFQGEVGLDVSPNTQYTLSAYFSTTTGASTNIAGMNLEWDEADADGNFLVNVPAFIANTLTSTPTQIVLTATTQSTTATLSPRLAFYTDGTNGETINLNVQIEAVQFEQGGAASAYQPAPFSGGLQIAQDGVVDINTSDVTVLVYWDGLVYQSNTAADWWYWNSQAWIQVGGDPRSSVVTWNIYDASPTVTFSTNDLTATTVGAGSQSVRSEAGYATGALYFEVTIAALTAHFAVGIANPFYNLAASARLGGDPTSIGFFPVPQSIFVGSSLGGRVGIGSSPPGQVSKVTAVLGVTTLALTWTAPAATSVSGDKVGDVISVAVNFNTNLIWFSSTFMRSKGFPWNGVTGANPATGVGGITFDLGLGPYYVTFNDDLGGASATVNFGASAFNQTIPAGFISWSTSAGLQNSLNTPTLLG